MSAETYLGETPYALEDSPFKDWTREQIAMHFIERYGQIDGGHHKTWVLDQVARALKGCPIIDLRQARWTDHEPEWRWELGESQEYLDWVKMMKGEWDEENGYFEYGYDEGIAP
jgi:hypothetical protein